MDVPRTNTILQCSALVWHLCGLSCTSASIPFGTIDVCYSRDGHRHVRRQTCLDEVTIVGGEEVVAPLEGGVGTRDAWGK